MSIDIAICRWEWRRYRAFNLWSGYVRGLIRCLFRLGIARMSVSVWIHTVHNFWFYYARNLERPCTMNPYITLLSATREQGQSMYICSNFFYRFRFLRPMIILIAWYYFLHINSVIQNIIIVINVIVWSMIVFPQFNK